MTWTLALDVVLALLMSGTIGMAAVLNRRLSEMRQHRQQLELLANTFRDATRRAEEGISALKMSSEHLKEELTKAGTLADDLRYLIERGDSTADRLEAGVRGHAQGQPKPMAGTRPAAASVEPVQSPAAAMNTAAAMLAAATAGSTRARAATAESAAAGNRKVRAGNPAAPAASAARVRSEAEKNLLTALGMQGLSR
jgi:hypothetical protein